MLYGLCLVALVSPRTLPRLVDDRYALGLATLFDRQGRFGFPWRAWFLTHLAAGLAVLPWMSQYIDHAPELITGPLSLRFLLGMPIAFIGGNSAVLLVCVLLIGYGLGSLRRREQGGVRVVLERAASFVPILIWLIVPPLFLYVYSLVAHPIFEARYTLFVGPAVLDPGGSGAW